MRSDPFDRARTPLEVVERELRSAGQWLCSLHPRLDRAVVRLWSYYVRLYPMVGNGTLWSVLSSPAPVDPFRVVEVDPDAIQYMVEYSAMPKQVRDRQAFPDSRFKYAGAVVDGDWDQSERRFEDSELYWSFEAHFEHGTPWRDTPFYDTVVDHIESGVEMWDCSSPAEFEARCRELDDLYAAIDRHGYRSQRELMASSVEDPVRPDDSRPYHVRLVNDELAVCIGRDGEVLFKDGRDRLAIAKLLDIDSIPVWILIRHERWQQLRELVALNPSVRTELPSRIRSHPDLEPLTD